MTAFAAPASSPATGHIRPTVALALPIVAARVGLLAVITVDSLAVGQTGDLELAAFGVGISPMTTLMLICLGALQGTQVRAAQAIGAGEPRRVGAIFRAAMVNALLLGLITGALAAFASPFFRLTGQAPDVAARASEVAVAFAWGMPGLLLFITANLLLETTGRQRVGMIVAIAAALVNVGLDGIFVLGWGGGTGGGAVAATATTSALRWGLCAVTVITLLAGARRRGDPLDLIGRPADWLAALLTAGGAEGRELRRIGLPMGLGQGVESAAFTAMILLAGQIGTAAVAAHQATMTLMSLVYMNAIGFGGAASIRVGGYLGAGDRSAARRAGLVAVGLGGVLSALAGLVLLAGHEAIAVRMVSDRAAADIAAITIATAGLVTGFDTLMGVTLGALRGLGDVWMPFIVQSGAFWFVAFPLAWWVGLHLGLGAPGLLAGLAAGILVSVALCLFRFVRLSAAGGAPSARAQGIS